MIHRLLHGHWPRWEPCKYDFLTWRYRCTRCADDLSPDKEKVASS